MEEGGEGRESSDALPGRCRRHSSDAAVLQRDVSTDAATRKNAAVGDARGRSAAQGAPSGGAPQGEPSESADHAPLPPAQWVELRGNLRVPLRVVEAVPLVKLVTHTYDEPGRKPLYFGAQWSFTLEPVEVEGMAGHATRVTLVEDGYVTSPTLRFLYGVLMGYATTCERFVTDLGSIVPELDEDEHGQAVLSAEAKARIAEAQRRREAARKREADVNALLAATPGIEATATPSATGAQAAPRGWPRAASRTAPTLRHRRLRAEP